jgi:N-dimethylarginine dimethylaminohydrolase
MLWNDKILVGYGCRNTIEIVSVLRDYFEKEVYGFELTNPMFYHLDTALCPINKKLIAVYWDAFTDEGKETLETLGCEILKLSYEDACAFALNSVVIGNNIIVHHEAKGFIETMKKRDFIVHEVDVSEFIKFGGGLKCLSFQHYLPEFKY